MNAECGECGAPMRQTYIILTLADGCRRIPGELRCTDESCLDRQYARDRAEQATRDQEAIQRAIERGVIDP